MPGSTRFVTWVDISDMKRFPNSRWNQDETEIRHWECWHRRTNVIHGQSTWRLWATSYDIESVFYVLSTHRVCWIDTTSHSIWAVAARQVGRSVFFGLRCWNEMRSWHSISTSHASPLLVRIFWCDRNGNPYGKRLKHIRIVPTLFIFLILWSV